MTRIFWTPLVLAIVLLPAEARGQTTFTVSSEAQLRAAIASAGAGDTILFASTITLTGDLPTIGSSVTIDGAGNTLSGDGQFRGLVLVGFIAGAPTAIDVTIQNLTIANTVASGGDGGTGASGGGGGAGLGGAIFVGDQVNLTLSGVTVTSSAAIGGSGGTTSGATAAGGGGGLGGDGGTAIGGDAGGGGGFGNTALGGSSSAGSPGIVTGGAPGGGAQFPGGPNGGGGGAGLGGGGGGGVAGGAAASGSGGNGGLGGGGGGASAAGRGGDGGFGGGGGASLAGFAAGTGGYGGGGGGTIGGVAALGGAFGGAGSTAGGGGGGAGLGGAIFVHSGATVVIAGTLNINGSAVTAGLGALGGANGTVAGAGMFFEGSGTIIFAPTLGSTATISDSISDEAGAGGVGAWTVQVDGPGRVILAGNNRYSFTDVRGGTLQVATGANLGLGDVTLRTGGTLAITGVGAFGQRLLLDGVGSLNVAPGASARWFGTISDDDLPSTLEVTGGGVLLLTNVLNDYAGGTIIHANGVVHAEGDGTLGAAGAGITLGDATTAGTLGVAAVSFATARPVTLASGGGIFETLASSTLTLNGSITGSGSLTKVGTGTLALGGANSFSGITRVTDGRLLAVAPNVIASSAGLDMTGGLFDLNGFNQSVGSVSGAASASIALAGAATLTAGGNNASTTFAGSIGGSGVITKIGTGAWTLTGANTYTGGTNVLGGSLIGTTTSLQGNIFNNALVVFDQAFSGVYAGAMTGAGALTKNGAGTLTLTGANTYSGGTTVSAGTLIGSSASVQGNILNNAAVVFDQAIAGTYAGTMTGTGTLTKQGAGLLTLGVANTHTGGTSVLGGVLRAGAVSAFGNTSLFVNAGATADLATFNQSLASIAGTGSIALGSAALSVGTGGASSTFDGVISGAGSLVKIEAGSLTLTGANTYGGGTSVLGGSLIGNTTSLQGSIFNNAMVEFAQGADGIYAGTMTGSGSLVKTGGGTLTLAGINTYSGGTSLLAGVLVGTSSSIPGNVLNNGTLVFSQPFSGMFNGAISGSGTLIKQGTGTLVLGATNTHTGGTAALGGVLQAGASNVFGTGSLLIGDAATVDLAGFSHSINTLLGAGAVSLGSATLTVGADGSSSAYDGAISGSGSLVKDGGGTFVLGGTNTYSGGTFVLGGTLAGTTASLQGNILNNAIVRFDMSGDGTYAGAMTGTGTLVKSGSGTLFLTGSHTFTGGTFVAGGTLSGTAGSLRGTIVNDANLQFSGNADALFQGVLSGVGSFSKIGTGTLSLTGVHPFSGLFTVSQGTLALDGTLGGSVLVAPNAIFRAAGSVLGSVNVFGSLFLPPATATQLLAADARALVSTGSRLNSSPILTIGGDFTMNPGSVLAMPVGSGPNPSLLVGGRALLDGTRIDFTTLDIGSARSATFLALSAVNGLTMLNTSATSVDPLLVPFLRQDPNNLFVTMLNMGVPLAGAARTPNTASVATAIDGFKVGATGDRLTVIRELTSLDDDALNDALRLVSGEAHASRLVVAIRDSESSTDTIRSQIAARDRETRLGGRLGVNWWTQFGGERGSLRNDAGDKIGTLDLNTGMGGLDWRPSDRWLFGGGGGFASGGVGLTDLQSSSDVKIPRGFGYAGWRPKGFGIRGGASFARQKSDTVRRITFLSRLPEALGGGLFGDGVDRQALSEEISVVNDQWSEYDDELEVKTYTLEWFAGLRRANFTRRGFVESGAEALSLLLSEQAITLRQVDARVHLWRREKDIRPFFEFLYRRETTDGATTTELEFADVDNSHFEVDGLPAPKNIVSARGGTTLMTMVGALTFEYQFRRATGQTTHTGNIRVRFK